MSDKTFGKESAFPQKNIEITEEHKGMSKRFYAACAAMNMQEAISTELRDEDMIEDKNGNYIKSSFGNYFISSYDHKNETTYSIKTSYNYRLVRGLYEIADELLKQENE